MKKAIVTVLCLLLCFSIVGCSDSNSAESADTQQPETPASDIAEQQETSEAGTPETPTVELMPLEINIPDEYDDRLVVDKGPFSGEEHVYTTISISEAESVKVGQAQHPNENYGEGWLLTISETDRLGYEYLASIFQSGFEIFAKSRTGERYFVFAVPTESRMVRENEKDMNSEETLAAWNELATWASSMKETILADNEELIEPFDFSTQLEGYTYEGEHKTAEYQPIPAEEGVDDPRSKTSAVITMSQPAKKGDGGVWCVERVTYIYNGGEDSYSTLIYPVAFGYDQTAEEFYEGLQSKADAGEDVPELTAQGALEQFVASDSAWTLGKVLDQFTFVESVE